MSELSNRAAAFFKLDFEVLYTKHVACDMSQDFRPEGAGHSQHELKMTDDRRHRLTDRQKEKSKKKYVCRYPNRYSVPNLVTIFIQELLLTMRTIGEDAKTYSIIICNCQINMAATNDTNLRSIGKDLDRAPTEQK